MDPVKRVIIIFQELAARRYPVSLQELSKVIECGERNTKKIIEKLRDYGAIIHYDREHNGYLLDKKTNRFQLPGILFDAPELHALLTSYQLLSSLQSGWLDDYIQPLKGRIEKLFGSKVQDFNEIQKRIRILQIASRPAELEKFQKISEALIKRKQLRILYHARIKDETSERTVSPQRLIYYRHNWYLDAWCHLRKALRSFSVDRVHPVTMLEQSARHIEEDELDEHYAQAYGIFAGPVKNVAHLRFSGHAARWVADEQWHHEQQGKVLKDGSYELRVPYGDPTELVMDILKYGPEVEVLKPVELRQIVGERIRRMANLYQEIYQQGTNHSR